MLNEVNLKQVFRLVRIVYMTVAIPLFILSVMYGWFGLILALVTMPVNVLYIMSLDQKELDEIYGILNNKLSGSRAPSLKPLIAMSKKNVWLVLMPLLTALGLWIGLDINLDMKYYITGVCVMLSGWFPVKVMHMFYIQESHLRIEEVCKELQSEVALTTGVMDGMLPILTDGVYDIRRTNRHIQSGNYKYGGLFLFLRQLVPILITAIIKITECYINGN